MGYPFSELVEQQKRLRGTDNEYHVLLFLSKRKTLWLKLYLEDLVPEWKNKSRIRVELELPTGNKREYIFNLPVKMDYRLLTPGSKIKSPSTEKGILLPGKYSGSLFSLDL